MIGVLLVNTGTPESPTYWGVRKYLSQFLSDPRVIDIPWFSRFLLLQTIILPLRSYRSAAAYKKVWTQNGSPFLANSLAYKEKLQKELGDQYKITLGMRYGKPSIEDAWKDLRNFEKILIFPLYPHYAASSTGSALEEIYRIVKKEWNIPSLQTIESFYKEPGFISSLSEHIQSELSKIQWEHLVFSFHGLPQHHIEKSGCPGICPLTKCHQNAQPFCYRAQCFSTVKHLSSSLNLNASQHSIAFQSRLGRRPWIKPYFDELLPELRKKNIKNLAVVCPSFVADCLETLEEIRIRAEETWKELGGNTLHLIPCLNDSDLWVQASARMIRQR